MAILVRRPGVGASRRDDSALRVVAATRVPRGDSPRAERDRVEHVRQIHRLVAAALRFRLQIARQQIGRVGFDQQPVGGNVPHHLTQMQAAALIADPARDADMQIQIEIGARFVDARGEAMRDAAGEAARDIPAAWRRKSSCASR